jgi:hypothetical protein
VRREGGLPASVSAREAEARGHDDLVGLAPHRRR